MKLAIVVVNFNTPGDTTQCLTSLKKATVSKNLTIKTILVDNASKDDSVDVFREKFPEVTLIESSKNLGFAGGHNLGIKESLDWNPTHILLLNPDTFVTPDFFKQIKNSVITKPKVGLVSGLLYFAPGFEFKNKYKKNALGKVVWYAGGHMDWDNILGSNAHVDEVDTGQFKQAQETDFATGACMIINRAVIDKVGLLNESYFLYLEDAEYSQRAKKAGYKVIFDPSIKLWHKVAQSSSIGSSLNDYFITRNRLLFGMKYAHLRTKFALIREAIRKLFSGTNTQKAAVKDFFLHRLGRGTWLK